MIKAKFISICLSLTLLAALLLQANACSNNPAGTQTTETDIPDSVSITDASGREITVKLPVERVAYLHPTVAEGLRIINAWDKVISIDNFTFDTVLFPDTGDMPVLTYTESGSIDYEQILQLQPDVLLVLPSAGTVDLEAVIAKLEPDIKVISVFDTYDSETWSKGLELLGTLMQREAEATEFIEFCRNIEEDISARTAWLSDADKPRVFLKTAGWSAEQFSTFTDEFGFVKKLMEATGAINIAADLPSTGGWVQEVDQEWLMTQRCDLIQAYIFESTEPGLVGFNITDDTALQNYIQKIAAMPAFADSRAVAAGEIYVMDTYLLTTPRYFILMEYSARSFHPELFSDIDPRATLQEYLNRFIRVNTDISEQGIFFYPEK
jgi:iron complex transport system substrate-binding protein